MIALMAVLLATSPKPPPRMPTAAEIEQVLGAATVPASVDVAVLGTQNVPYVEVDQYLKTRARLLVACFDGQTAAAAVKARLSFGIDGYGRASGVTVDVPFANVAICLQDQSRAWLFPVRVTGKVEAQVTYTAPTKRAPTMDPIFIPPQADPGPGIKGRVTFGTPTVNDRNVDAEVLQRYMRSRMAAVQGCYEKELRRAPELRGTTKLKYTITKLGRATDLEATATVNDALESCVKAIVRGWVFPFKPDADVPVEVVLTFAPAP